LEMAWVRKGGADEAACFEVDADTKGALYRRPGSKYRCPTVIDPYVAFGRREPVLIIDAEGAKKGRMPASAGIPIDSVEEYPDVEDEPEGKKSEFWEDLSLPPFYK
jgi:hypothetical protein